MTKEALQIGFIPLTDSAPLVIAKEKGFFDAEGLEVTLSRETSWSQVRDKLGAGLLDASHLLAPMAPASWLDNSYAPEPLLTGVSLNLNGSAITVSSSLYEEMVAADPEAMIERPVTARALKKVIANRITSGGETIAFGSVFPYSSHYYAIRYWLGAEGIDPDRDVRIVVAPPPVMVEQLEQGLIDAFCVGEPWNTVAEFKKVGRAIVRSSEIWRHMPEKVLGVRAQWAEENHETHLALIRAVLRAAQWLDVSANRLEACHILSTPEYVGVGSNLLATAIHNWPALRHRRSILQSRDALIFHHYAANFPWRSHALWFLSQMTRWGQIAKPVNIEQVAMKAYRPDIYREAATALGVDCPHIDRKVEGVYDRSWLLEGDNGPIVMSSGAFIDEAVFDPDHLPEYMETFMRHHLRIKPEDVLVS